MFCSNCAKERMYRRVQGFEQCNCNKNQRTIGYKYCEKCSSINNKCGKCGIKIIIQSDSGQQVNKITEPSHIIQSGNGQQINFF